MIYASSIWWFKTIKYKYITWLVCDMSLDILLALSAGLSAGFLNAINRHILVREENSHA